MNNLIYLIGQIITAGVFFIIGMLVIAIRLKSRTIDIEDDIENDTVIENCKSGCKCTKCRERSINTMLRQEGETGYGVCNRCTHKNKCDYWCIDDKHKKCEAIKVLIELYESYDERENKSKEVH